MAIPGKQMKAGIMKTAHQQNSFKFSTSKITEYCGPEIYATLLPERNGFGKGPKFGLHPTNVIGKRRPMVYLMNRSICHFLLSTWGCKPKLLNPPGQLHVTPIQTSLEELTFLRFRLTHFFNFFLELGAIPPPWIRNLNTSICDRSFVRTSGLRVNRLISLPQF